MKAEIAVSIITIIVSLVICLFRLFHSASYKQMKRDLEDIKEMRRRSLEIERQIKEGRNGKGIRQ